jgi:hypothetical protein
MEILNSELRLQLLKGLFNMSFDAISESLNVGNVIISNTLPTIIPTQNTSLVPVDDKTDAEQDYITVRETYKELLNIGSSALAGAFDSANETGKASSYDAISNMIKVLSEVNEKLYNMHKQKKEISDIPESQQQNISVDKGIIVGNSADILKMLKDNASQK